MTQKNIPMLDVCAQNRDLADELRSVFERVMSHGHFILGKEVLEFEQTVEQYLDIPHAIGVSSGTDALLMSLMALDLKPGDEVVTTPFSFFATAGCILRLGLNPVFVDIDPGTFNLDTSKIEAVLTPRTKAILPVHLFGQPCDMDGVMQIAHRHHLTVIEDAAQAFGARSDGQPIGGMGNVGCFSFFPSKNLGAFGDAGMVVTRDAALAERLRTLRVHGSKPKYFHALVGGNFRMDALQAALLKAKLPHLSNWTEGRKKNAEKYTATFNGSGVVGDKLVLPKQVQSGHVWNQYVIRTPWRNELKKHLETQGISTEIYYPLPLHLQECLLSFKHKPNSMPIAERASEEVLALPIFPEMGASALERVATETIHFLKTRSH